VFGFEGKEGTFEGAFEGRLKGVLFFIFSTFLEGSLV
jgi:hypothetical protein